MFEADMHNLMFGFIEVTNVPGMGFTFYSDSAGRLELSTLYSIQSATKFFLAKIIEDITNQTIGQAFRQRILEPVNMSNTDGYEFKYGLGLEVMTNMYDTTVLGQAVGTPGYIHQFYFSPETSEIIIFFFNDTDNLNER